MADVEGKSAIAALAGLALGFASLGVAAAQARDFDIKAGYMLRAVAFIEWPAGAFSSPLSPLNLCLVGADPFGVALDEAAKAQVINGRPVAIRRLARIETGAGCHLVYVGKAAEQPTHEFLTKFAAAPMLIVTDEAWGPEHGHIHLVIADDRVRFYVDDAAARRAGLSISSRLLSVALPARPAGAL